MPTAPALQPEPVQRCQLCAARLTCLVGQLPRAQQEKLDPMLRELGFRKGDLLQTEGTAPHVVRTIKLGTVMLTRCGPDGAHHPVALAGRGHLLGMWGMLDKPAQVGAQALSAGRVCELPVAALRHTLHQDATLLDALHHQMAQAFARLADWSQVMRLRGLPRQLMATLMLLANEQGTRTVHLPSQVALAALLSTSRESVARALRRLQLDGHVRRIDRWHAELGSDLQAVFETRAAEP
jgi:CRP/FNR family transcriptional regulator, cyclic AMP receptor protein